MPNQFLEIRFPELISWGSSGGPQFSTAVTMTSAGREKRNINWSKARAVYDVSHAIKTQQELDQLHAFFRIVRGRAVGFRYKDWSDFKVAASTGFINGLGGGSYQLQKEYLFGGQSYRRDIKKPVTGTIKLYAGGVLTPGGTIDYATGIVTSLPGGVDSWGGEFDIPCRFDTDSLKASIDEYNVYTWGGITIVEIRVD